MRRPALWLVVIGSAIVAVLIQAFSIVVQDRALSIFTARTHSASISGRSSS